MAKEQNPRSDHVSRETSTAKALPKEVLARLEAYLDLIRSWAPKLDLISPGDLERLHERHLYDALRAVPLIDSLPDGPAVDVGSGAGFPGFPLALAGRPRPWCLLEPRRRRAAFLEVVTRELAPDVEVAALRAEEAAREPRFVEHAVAVARALAPPKEALDLMTPLLREGGTAILWVGIDAELPPGSRLSAPGLATLLKE